MVRDASFLRRQLACAFLSEAFRLKRNPPQWSSLSVAQADEYLSHAVQRLLAELPFRRERAPESAEERADSDGDATSV